MSGVCGGSSSGGNSSSDDGEGSDAEDLTVSDDDDATSGGGVDNAVSCRRDFHVYVMSNINGMLIVADPKCARCFVQAYKDGPQEGKTN